MILKLAPYVTLVLLLYGLTYYRVNKRFKADKSGGLLGWMERNPVEGCYALGVVACVVMIWPGAAEWLGRLL